MKLFIDTSDSKKITVGLDDKKFESDSKEKSSQRLLPFIHEVLEKNNTSIDKITQIEVNTGPGSFTGLRVGVAVAQTLAWQLGVPINGKKVSEGEPLKIQY